MEQLSTLEMMEAIKEQNKKSLMYQRLNTLLMLVFIAVLLSVVPTFISTMKIASNTLKNANEAVIHANNAVTQMETTMDSIQLLVEDSGDGMEQAITKMNSLDIDTLNNAIEDLSEVVKPMADFFGKFK